MMNKVIENPKKVKEGFMGQRMIVLPPNVKSVIMQNELIKRFHLTAIGYYPKANYHDRERKSGCNQYILLYCTEGSGNIHISGKVISLKPNMFYILPKNRPHHYLTSKDDPWSIYWVHFTGESADFLFKRYEESVRDATTIPYNENRIKEYDEILYLLEDSFEERGLEIINIKLLNYISSFIYQNEINPAVKENDIVNKSISFMKENLSNNLFVKDLADQQNMSLSHYLRIFRAKTGQSPYYYFNKLKIQKSCQYLYFTDLSIKEICLKLGFDDPYYFSRLFRKLMGISPLKYKNQHKKSVK